MKTQTFLKNSLGANAHWQVNKHLALSIGHLPAILLSHFIDILSNYENMPDEFYQQKHRIMESLGFSEYELEKAINILKSKGLINVVRKGLPPKNYYSLNSEKITELMSTSISSKKDNEELVVPNGNPLTVNTVTPLPLIESNPYRLKQRNKIDKETIKDKKTRTLDNLGTSKQTQDIQENIEDKGESIAKAIQPLLTAKAVELNSIDDLSLDIQVENTSNNNISQDISLDDVIQDESNIEVKTNASSREHIKTTQSNNNLDIQQEFDNATATAINKLDINKTNCLLLKLKYTRELSKPIDENTVFEIENRLVPVDQLENLTLDNLLIKGYNWKSNFSRIIFQDEKKLINSAAVLFIDSKGIKKYFRIF